jgi:glycosyltransferase involved in cell wall biosynthesis
MADDPLVTVVIPAHNAALTLGRALRSALAQRYRPLEILVIDDGSRDDTAAIAENFGAPEIRVIRLPRNRGVSAARNAGAEAARGELVAFLDADDEWLPERLARQIPLMMADPQLVFVACGAVLVSRSGAVLGPLYDGKIPRAGARAWVDLLGRNTVQTSTVLVRRSELLASGGFDPGLRVSEDQDLWIRLALRGPLGYVDASLVRVHDTPDSLSSGGFRALVSVTMPMIERHLAATEGDLSAAERRAILRERWARIGRQAYSEGAYLAGLRLLLGAMARGDRPLGNLLFLVIAAPPMRGIKRVVRACLATR